MLIFLESSVIIVKLDMRRSERLLSGDALTGNFRGVCPFEPGERYSPKHEKRRKRAVWFPSVFLNPPRNLSA